MMQHSLHEPPSSSDFVFYVKASAMLSVVLIHLSRQSFACCSRHVYQLDLLLIPFFDALKDLTVDWNI